MSMETWGQVPKEQNDSQLISEAITAAIVDHEADPVAHQGDGESLQNHKSDEVIDHPPESVVADKYADFSVDYLKILRSKNAHILSLESTDSWVLAGTATLEDCELQAGMYMLSAVGTTGKYAQISYYNSLDLVNFDTKNPLFETTIYFQNTTNQTIYCGCGRFVSTGHFMGFKVTNDTLYACTREGTTESVTSIATITQNTPYRLRAVMTSATKIEFYLNDTIVYTKTTDLPSNNAELELIIFYIKNNDGAEKTLRFAQPVFIQDL